MRSAARRSGLRAALAPHWGALLALALFLIVGLAVLDDYGVTTDESTQRSIGQANLAYVAGESALMRDVNRFYGVGFEAPLTLLERFFWPENPRAIHLSRHLITHLFFLSGGLFAYLLARRLLRGKGAALLALPIFLLHPRLYAHSFFNDKDIPFLTLFMLTLFLAHRAFRRGSVSAHCLLGASAGLLVQLRIMGLVLVAAVVAMQTLDLLFASGRAERKRVLVNAAGFALAGFLAAYALLPYLWSDPVGRAARWWQASARFPTDAHEIFRGAVYWNPDFPPEYLPVWIAITTPTFLLLAGLIGSAAVIRRGVGNPGRLLRNARARFAAMLLGCFVLSVAAVISLDANIYNGWRQMYFLWAPFSLLALFGLAGLASAFRQARPRAAVYGAVGAGLTATLISMALIHPNQHVFFNSSVDRTTPEYLRTQFVMDYWGHSVRAAWERALAERPLSPATVNPTTSYGAHLLEENKRVLPEAARRRASTALTEDALVLLYSHGTHTRVDPSIYRVAVYDNTLWALAEKPDLAAAYERTVGEEPVARPAFRIYDGGDSLVYVKDACSEAGVAETDFNLRATPKDLSDLPEHRRVKGVERLDFRFPGYGAIIAGRCVASVPLPEYAVAGFRASRMAPLGDPLWEAEFTLNLEEYQATFARIQGEEPVARSVFDLHLLDGGLAYIKEPCAQADTTARFFLHVVPERADDLPRERRGAGFDNLDFAFFTRGAHFDGGCAASVPLPGYPIASIRTGQFVSGEGELWRAEFAPAGG